MNREEFREQMTRCQSCGEMTDGGCCEPAPLAFMIEREFDREGDESGPAEAMVNREFYCLDCADNNILEEGAVPVTDISMLRNPYLDETCWVCGVGLA